MGGRGASSGMSDKGKKYGSEYTTVLSKGNIKFLKGNFRNGTTPFETMTKGRVYVSVNDKNQLKTISYYDTKGKRCKSIDLTHFHEKMNPHTHHGYIHNENDSKKGAANVTTEEKKMVEKVKEIWYDYLNNK